MKTLLRSTFLHAKGDREDLSLRNYLALVESGLGFENPMDTAIWGFIQRFVRRHNHVPAYDTLVTNFKANHQDDILDRLEALTYLSALAQGDFLTRLEAKAHERRVRQVGDLIKDASVIVSTGIEVQDGKEKKVLQGPIDAVRYFLEQSHAIISPTLGARLSGEATRDGAEVRTEYERVEADPLAGVGQWSGLPQMDTALSGAKRHELWIHAAFTGGLKSTLMLNWAYNQAVFFHHDSVVFSLEMPYQQCRRILYAIHSAHEKFRTIRHQLGLQKDALVTVGLPYTDIRDGTLEQHHSNAKRFLLDYVIPDLGDKVNKYGKIHIEVPDPDRSDFTVANLREKAELLYSDSPFATVFVDHCGLMAPRRWISSTTERLNEVIRDLKRLAMSFNRGQGIAVVGLFQIGREGFKRVKKAREAGNRNEFQLFDLSYANEAERSADIVTATYVDKELVKQNRVELQNLKSRDQAPFETFLARVEWPCRRILPCYDVPMIGQGGKQNVQAAIDKAAEQLDL